MIEPEELRDIYEFIPKENEPKLGPIFITKDGRFFNLGEGNEHSSIFGESEYDSEDYEFLEDNYGLIKANGGNVFEPIPYIDLRKVPNEAQRRAISKWVDLLMASGKRSVQVNSGLRSSVVGFGDNDIEDICKDIVRAATRPISESLSPGQMVSISNTGTFWDGKIGTLEEIDEGNSSCTVFVDFDSEGNKKVRQDFDLVNVFDIANMDIDESFRDRASNKVGDLMKDYGNGFGLLQANDGSKIEVEIANLEDVGENNNIKEATHVELTQTFQEDLDWLASKGRELEFEWFFNPVGGSLSILRVKGFEEAMKAGRVEVETTSNNNFIKSQSNVTVYALKKGRGSHNQFRAYFYRKGQSCIFVRGHIKKQDKNSDKEYKCIQDTMDFASR